MPAKIPEFKIKDKALNILDLLVKTKLTPSKSEAKRLIFQKGVRINGQIQTDWRKEVEIKRGLVLQAGKRKFIKIV
jgi:tyrosyl-tRNA synthetase